MEPGQLGTGSSMRVSPFNSNVIIVSGDVYGAAISEDGGLTWQPCKGLSINNQPTGTDPIGQYHGYVNDFTFVDSQTIWASTLAGPALSTDGGHTFHYKRSSPMLAISYSTNLAAPIQKVAVDPMNPVNVVAAAGFHRHLGTFDTTNDIWGSIWKGTNNAGTVSWSEPYDLFPGETSGSNFKSINNIEFLAGQSSQMLAATDAGVFQSTDGGTTWTGPLNINGTATAACRALAVHPTDSTVAWVGYGGNAASSGIYKGTRSGSTWTWSHATGSVGTTSSAILSSIAVSRSDPSILYSSFSKDGGVYKSINGGLHWTNLLSGNGSKTTFTADPASPSAFFPQWMEVDPNDSARVYANSVGYIARSTDSGAHWLDITSVIPTVGVWRGYGWSGVNGSVIKWNTGTSAPKGQVFTLGWDSSKLLRSENYLWSWKLKDAPTTFGGQFNGAQDVAISEDGLTVYVAANQGTIDTTPDPITPAEVEPILKGVNSGGTTTWSYLTYPGGGTTRHYGCLSIYANPSDMSKIWAIYGKESSPTTLTLYYSDDTGATWTAVTLPGTTPRPYNLIPNTARPGTPYVGTPSGILQTTTVAPTVFTALPGTVTNGTNALYVYPSPSITGGLYALQFNAGSGKVYQFDGSSTWNIVWNSTNLSGFTRAVAEDPNDSGHVVMITRSGPNDGLRASGIWEANKSGGVWPTTATQINTDLRMAVGKSIAFNPDHSEQLIAGFDGGFFVTDFGKSTAQSGTPAAVPGTILAASFDNGGRNVAYGGVTTVGVTGTSVNALVAGEWLKYQVNVANTTTHKVTFNYTLTSGTNRIHLEANGVNVTGPVTLTGTSITLPDVKLTKGTQYLKVYVESAGTMTLNSMVLDEAGSTVLVSVVPADGQTIIGGYDLTKATGGSTNAVDDWVHYGRGSATQKDRKNLGGAQFSALVTFTSGGTFTQGWGMDAKYRTSWSDSVSPPFANEISYSSLTGAIDTGIKFSVQARPFTRTLTMVFGATSTDYTLKTHLSDGSAADVEVALPQNQVQIATIRYACSAQTGGQLTVYLTKKSATGEVRIASAWVH